MKRNPLGYVQNQVFNLQYKISKHSKRNDKSRTLYYQKKLVNSEYAKLMAVCMITQDNREKKTAGVDELSELTPVQRFQLVIKMILNGKASTIKRVWISKDERETATFGYPTMEDRAKQCLVKIALEPE